MICKKVINGVEKEFDLDLNKNGFIYDDEKYTATNGRYMVIGVHNDNPGCYEYLEMIIVYDIETEKYKLVKVWNYIGSDNTYPSYDERSKLESVTYENGNFIIKSAIKTAYVYPDIVMAEDIKKNTIICPELDITKMETCFDYEVMEDWAILMTLKEDVPMTQFLKWSGFDMSYNAFKLWGPIIDYGQSHLLFVNTKTGNSWTVSWGIFNSTVGDYVWDRKAELIKCIKKILPNHPNIRNSCYMKTI